MVKCCLLYTSPSPRDRTRSRMPSSAWKKKEDIHTNIQTWSSWTPTDWLSIDQKSAQIRCQVNLEICTFSPMFTILYEIPKENRFYPDFSYIFYRFSFCFHREYYALTFKTPLLPDPRWILKRIDELIKRRMAWIEIQGWNNHQD